MTRRKIDTINIDLTRKTTNRSIQTLGEELVEVRKTKVGRQYKRRDKSKAGTTTGLTIVGYFERIFVKNELLACIGAPATNPQIEANLLKEFPSMRLGYIQNHRLSIGLYRNRYMKRTLLKHQAIPIFVSLRYDEEGLIVKSSNGNTYMSQTDVLDLCYKFKIADPRFFSRSELVEIASGYNAQDPKYAGWNFPTAEDIKQIKTQIKKDPYGCMRFPEHLDTSRYTH